MPVLIFIFFLSVLQGATEFLPVSSSGHLAFFENLPVFAGQTEELKQKISLIAFNVILHAGTLLAVIAYWFRDIKDLTTGFFSEISRRENGRSVHKVILIIVATLPAATVPLFKDYVEQAVHSLTVIGALFIYNGILLVFTDRLARRQQNTHTEDAMRLPDALLVGLFQITAVFPGISRSGSTIAAALLRRNSGMTAVRFSFLISIPILTAATLLEVKELYDAGGGFTQMPLMFIAIGIFVSFLTGILSLRMLVWLGRKLIFYPFGIYTIALGTGILIYQLTR